jgi:hypothetical protein
VAKRGRRRLGEDEGVEWRLDLETSNGAEETEGEQ